MPVGSLVNPFRVNCRAIPGISSAPPIPAAATGLDGVLALKVLAMTAAHSGLGVTIRIARYCASVRFLMVRMTTGRLPFRTRGLLARTCKTVYVSHITVAHYEQTCGGEPSTVAGSS